MALFFCKANGFAICINRIQFAVNNAFALVTADDNTDRISGNPLRGQSVLMSSQDWIHTCSSDLRPMALVFGIFQNRPSVCGLRARKKAPVSYRHLRWCWLLNHSRFAPCELFGNQDCLHIVASLLGRSTSSPCALAPQRSPLALRARAHPVGNQRFPPLNRSPAGIVSAETNARHMPMRHAV